MFFSGSIRLGRIAGIPIYLDYSWLLLFFLVSAALTLGQFLPLHPHEPVWLLIGLGMLASLLFAVSILLHELAHSLLALRFGVPVRSITLFLLGGVSQIEREAERPSREFLIAAAGPLCSLLLAFAFGAAWLALTNPFSPAGTLLEALTGVNLVMAIFNMVPGFPLDGGRVFRSALWAATRDFGRATRIAARTGRGIAFLLIAGGALAAAGWNGQFLANGLWLAVIGLFLERAAVRSYRQEQVRAALTGVRVADVMERGTLAASSALTLSRLAEDGLVREGGPAVLVTDGPQQTPIGVIGPQQLRRAQRNRRDSLTVAEVMTPLDRLPRLRPETDALLALEHLEAVGAEVGAVLIDGRVAGLVGRDDLLRFDRGRRQTGQQAA